MAAIVLREITENNWKECIGLKVTAITRRTFKPNLQTVRAVVDGRPTRIKVSARAIKQGKIVKPLKRKYGYTRQQRG